MWQNLSSASRDKIVFDALFDHDIDESTPMFSDNIKDNAATSDLIAKLAEKGFDNIVVEKAPRSILSVVRVGNITLPVMPAHKAVGYIGYLIAVSQSE